MYSRNEDAMRCIKSGIADSLCPALVRAKACLRASRQEVVARKAARDLFASLSNGEQYITTAQLERRIREICNVTLKEAGDDSDTPDEDGRGEHFAPEIEEQERNGALELDAREQICGNGTLRPTDECAAYPDTCQPNEEIRNLTVDNLVSAAVDYCQGEMPLVTYELTLTDPNIKALDHIPLLHQAFLHPIVFLQLLYLKLLYYFGSFSFRLSNVEFSLILIAYLSVNADNVSHLVPLALYYSSFIAMVVCTFKMLHAKRQFVDFRKWSGLFLRYSDGNLQPDESENLFVRNNLAPFLQFFIALFVNLFIYPLIATQWVPFSEFCVLSFALMFLTMFSFGTNNSAYPDFLALISFAINILAKYPYEKDTVVHKGWRYLDLHIQNYPSYILGTSIEFCVNSRVFFSLLIPVILFFMARRNHWRGFLKYTLPHCVTLSWLQMFIMCSHGCTTYGLVRGVLGLVCSLLFVPLIGVLTLTLPILAFLQCVTLSRVVHLAVVVVGLGSGLGLVCLLAKLETTRKFVTPLQLSVGVVLIAYFCNQFAMTIQHEGVPTTLLELFEEKPSIKNLLKNEFNTDYDDNSYTMTWEEYYSQCHAPSWMESNMAATQIKCSVLDGTYVNWEGYVKEVSVKSVKNVWKDFSAWLPGLLQQYFSCYYGEEYATLCPSTEGLMSDKTCEFVRRVARQSGKSCHLDNLNEYTYEVKLTMAAGGGLITTRHIEIDTVFEHHFSNFTRQLHTDDKIRFKGILLNERDKQNIGHRSTIVKGYEITCLECKNSPETITSKVPTKLSDLCNTLLNDCIVSTKYVLNFMLNPVVVFK